MQESCGTILSMAPPFEKSEVFAPVEQGQEAWIPYPQGAAPTARPVERMLEKCPMSGTWWNSYRSPVNVRSDSSSSDDESSSEKEEEGNVQLEGPRITKPQASLLGQCDFRDKKAESCKGLGSQLQGCQGSIRGQFHHANENNGDLFGNSQQITDARESQNPCSKCGKSFARKASLTRHVRVHGSEKAYQCSICSKRFLEKWNFTKHLRKHMKSSRTEEKSYICPECGEKFITSASYAKHQRTHASEITYQCPECERSYAAKKHLVRHLMKAHLGANLYKCSVCEKGFLEETDLVRHQTMTHKTGGLYRCPDCGKGYKQKSSLLKHQRIHMRKSKMNFRDHPNLTTHWRMHEKEEFHKFLNCEMKESNMPEETTHLCPDCGKCFKDESCFADHQRTHTREQQHQCLSGRGVLLAPNQIVQEGQNCNRQYDGGQHLGMDSSLTVQPKTTRNENLYICPDCGKVFKGDQCFANHLKSHTQVKQTKTTSQEETFEESMLLSGQQEMSPKQSLHRCPTCEKVYATESNLKRHQQVRIECRPSESTNKWKSFPEGQKDHAEEQPHQHKCSYCGKEFRTKHLLNKHRKTHSEGKPYQCTDCGETLAYEHIFSHYREFHSEGQVCPYQCAHCGKVFRTPSSLRRHQQLHTEGKPYRCSTCGKGFAFKDALAHHQEIHILMQERSYICLFCGKTFTTNNSLNKHKRIHMETRSYQCSICEKAFGTKYSLTRHLLIHAKKNQGRSSSGEKDLGSSSALAKNQSSDTEENSNNWSDSSTLSGHREGKNSECCKRMYDSALSESSQGTNLEECSAESLDYERTFRGGQDQVCSGHRKVPVEKNSHKYAESRDTSTLHRHQKAHSEENSAEWLEDDRTIKAGSILIQDQRNQNVSELIENSVSSGHQGTPVENNSPECSENRGTFLASSTPIKHRSTHREENSARGIDGEKLIKGSSSKSSSQKTTVSKKSHTCSECGKSFKDRYTLKRHSYTHSVVRPYHCQKCEKTFVTPRDLAKHQMSHTDLRPYPCTECGKCFKSKSAVYKHQMTHKGEKPYCCIYCGKRVTTSYSLTCHLRIHTGEKPYKCAECNTGYVSSWSLKKHLQTHLKKKTQLRSPMWMS